MKIKIIDLLNKIANGEKIPLKIKVKGYEYRQSNGQFWCDETEMYLIDNCTSICHLNDEVEIIEEDKEIEKLENEIEFYSYSEYESYKNEIDRVLYILKGMNLTEEKIKNMNNNINKLIDEVNRLKNKQ